MRKKIIFVAFCSIFAYWNGGILASKHFLASTKMENCNAPAPDSLWLVNISEGYVNIAWTPSEPNLSHTVTILSEDASGSWNAWAHYPVVLGNTFAIPGMSAGSYKIRISTNCSSGNTGDDEEELLVRIIDLMTAGRLPKNPTPVACGQLINTTEFAWIGFRVKEIYTGNYSLFEFVQEGIHGLIRRVGNGPIKAVDDNGFYPILPGDIVVVGKSFKIDDKNKLSDPEIGMVNFSQALLNNNVLSVGFCNDDNSWKSAYTFTALTAKDIIVDFPNGGVGGTGLTSEDSDDAVSVQNPFSDNLELFFREDFPINSPASVNIFDFSGKRIVDQSIELSTRQVTIPTIQLPSGIYIIRIEGQNRSWSFKSSKY